MRHATEQLTKTFCFIFYFCLISLQPSIRRLLQQRHAAPRLNCKLQGAFATSIPVMACRYKAHARTFLGFRYAYPSLPSDGLANTFFHHERRTQSAIAFTYLPAIGCTVPSFPICFPCRCLHPPRPMHLHPLHTVGVRGRAPALPCRVQFAHWFPVPHSPSPRH